MKQPAKKKDAKEIFNAAVEYYMPDQWEGYLVTACGEDEALRQRVRELLAAHRQSDSFFDERANVMTEGSEVSERPGTQIGPYKLLQEIGEGGFGVVYMAEQVEPVRRKVALKIIKPGMDTKQVIARFEAERQALAMMDHPNIAKVLGAGSTESGRPFFVMELVKGVPITEFCDSNKLDTQERLELFVTVCHAVQHAHQKGVIHRDLKPSNVMVTLHDNKPMPVIIDFGVSKAISHQLTEKTLFTAYGQMVGTPAYMSPEQAQMSRMDIDTRSDIYSLGVLLYELLTGSTPIDAEQLRGTAYAEMQRLIREEEAPKPSTRVSTLGKALAKIAKDRSTDPKKLGQFLRGDLDWIVMKALEKERSRRYDTANGLASDIERFLNDETVEACPPSFAYQVRKFVGRNRGLVTTASAIAAAILLGIIGTTYGMIQAQRDAERARAAAIDANLARQRADKLAEEKKREATTALESKRAAEAARADAQAQVAKQLVTRAGIERERGDITLAALLDAEALKIDQSDPDRAASHRRRLAAELRQCPRPTQVFFHDGNLLDARLSDNGKWVATSCEDGTVQVWDLHAGNVLRRFDQFTGAVTKIDFRRDDTRLVVLEEVSEEEAAKSGKKYRLHVFDWSRGRLLRTLSADGRNWPDEVRDVGELLYRSPAEDEIEAISVETGQRVGDVIKVEGTDRFWHYHGDWIAIGRSIRQESTEELSRSSATSQRLPYRTSLRIELWRPRTGERTTLVDPLMDGKGYGRVGATCYSNSTGTRLAIRMALDRGSISKWSVFDTTTGLPLPGFEFQTEVRDRAGWRPVLFGPTDQFLLCTRNGNLGVFDLAAGDKPPTRITDSPAQTRIGAHTRCMFSPDGSRILSINRQEHPQIWSRSTGRELTPPLDHKSDVHGVSFSPDGRYVQVSCADGTVRVWDSLTAKPVTPLLKHMGSITKTLFTRDGSHLLVASRDGVVLWPLNSPEFKQAEIPFESVTSDTAAYAFLSPNGKWVVTSRGPGRRGPGFAPAAGTGFGGERGFGAGLGIRGRRGFVEPPSESDNNEESSQRDAGNSVPSEIRVWDASSGQLVHGPITFTISETGRFGPAYFSPDSARLLMPMDNGDGGEPGSCIVLNLESGDMIELESQHASGPFSAYFVDDGRRIVTNRTEIQRINDAPTQDRNSRGSFALNYTYHVRLWDANTGTALGPTVVSEQNVIVPGGTIRPPMLNEDGSRCLVYGSGADDEASTVAIYDLLSGKRVCKDLHLHSMNRQFRILVCDQGRRFLNIDRRGDDLELSFWNFDDGSPSGKPILVPFAVGRGSMRAQIDSTANFVALQRVPTGRAGLMRGSNAPPQVFARALQQASEPADSTVTVFDVQRETTNHLRHELSVYGWEFSPTGRLLMTTTADGVVRVWDPRSGELVKSMRSSLKGEPFTARFSKDGNRIVMNAPGRLQIWDIGTGQPLSEWLGRSTSSNRRDRATPTRGRRAVSPTSDSAQRCLLMRDESLVIHDLAAEDRSVDELNRMTEVLSGRIVNALGNVETLPPHMLRQAWHQYRDALRDRLLPAPVGIDWHRLQIGRDDDDFANLWHLDLVLEQDRDDVPLLVRRGRIHARLGQYDLALADFDAAMKLGETNLHQDRANALAYLDRWNEVAHELELARQNVPQPSEQRFAFGPFITENSAAMLTEPLAITSLIAGDRDEYEKLCLQVLADRRNPDSLRTERSRGFPQFKGGLRFTLLVPRDREFCEEVESVRSQNPRGSFFDAIMERYSATVTLNDLIELRRGDYEKIVTRVDADQWAETSLSTGELFILAIALHELGETDRAKRTFARGSVHQVSPPDDPDAMEGRQVVSGSLLERLGFRQMWVNDAITEILRREASERINDDDNRRDSNGTEVADAQSEDSNVVKVETEVPVGGDTDQEKPKAEATDGGVAIAEPGGESSQIDEEKTSAIE